MKWSFKTYLIIIMEVMLAGSLVAQNYAQDMDKIEQKFRQGDISFHIHYLFHPYDSLKIATDSMNAYCSLSKGNYYYKITSMGKEYEYIKNGKYFFVVDHKQNAIAVKKSSESTGQVWDMSKIDSLMHAGNVKVSYKQLVNNEGEYDVKVPDGVWTTIKLVFNRTNYTVVKMSMHSTRRGSMYGQRFSHPDITVYYTGYTTSPADKSLFNEAKFFSENGGTITLTDIYKKYKLLNYLQRRS